MFIIGNDDKRNVEYPKPRVGSKKSVQQGRSQFSARSVLSVREHKKLGRTPLADFFNRPLLIAGLLGIHLTLMTVGTFCASTAINPNPSHHEDHQSSTSILCVWACQVGQIAASATPTENLTPLPLLILLGIILPLAIPAIFSPFFFASPRGPPLF